MPSSLKRFGVYLFPWGKRPPSVGSIVSLAQHADALGFDSVHVPWHYTLPTNWIFPEFGNRYVLDPLVILPVLTQETNRIKLSLNAAVAPAMHPFAWAQFFASLDSSSGGRTIAALALGWWQDDFLVGGARMTERGKRTDEALGVITKLWCGDVIDECGSYWDARGLRIDPRPAQQPLPLWIGGGIKSADRAARWGSALMPLTPTPEEVREVLRPGLSEAGARWGTKPGLAMMNYAFISSDSGQVREMRSRVFACTDPDVPEGRVLLGNARECADQCRALFDAGIDYMVLDFQLHGWETEEFAKDQMTRFAQDVVPLLG